MQLKRVVGHAGMCSRSGPDGCYAHHNPSSTMCTLQSVAVINTGIGALSGVGLVLGVLAAGAMMTYHGKRALDAGTL